MRLTKSQWSTVFTEPYTDGNVGLGLLFFQWLRYSNENNVHCWYWDPMDDPDIDHLNTLIAQRFRYHAHFQGTTAEYLTASANFQDEYKRFMSLNEVQRRRLLMIYRKHWLLTNAVLFKYRAAWHEAKTWSTKVWDMMTATAEFVWTKIKDWKMVIAQVLAVAAVIGLCTAFSKMFLPKYTSFRQGSTYSLKHKGVPTYRDWETDRKSTRLNSSHITRSRMPSSA